MVWMIAGLGPNFKLFLIYQPTAINQKSIKIGLRFFLTKVSFKAITNKKHRQLKLADRIMLPFNQVYKQKLISSLHNRGKNELEILLITYTNI